MKDGEGDRDVRGNLLHSSQCTYLLTTLHIMIPQRACRNRSDFQPR